MSRRTVVLLFVSFVLFYFSALGTMPLLEPDEGRYAEIPREMLATGDFVTPHLNGVAYLEKPPLFYWGNALSLRLFGENEFAARGFTAAVSVAGILLTYWMGSALSGWRTGLFSAIVLSTSLYYYAIGRLNTLDMTLAVTLLLAIFPAYLYHSGKRESRWYLHLSYAAAGLAFLCKGLVGVVFPAAILVCWLVFSRRHRELFRAISLPGILLFLAIVLPWIVLVQRRNPDFLWFFFIREHLLRYATKMHHRYQPFWFFLPIVVGGFVPWIAFLRRGAVAVRGAAQEFFSREDLVFLLSWVLFIFLFFSLSRSKLPTYVAPIFPPLAVLFGRALDLWAEREDGAVRCRAPLALAGLVAAAIVAVPSFSRHHVDPSAWMRIAALPVLLILLWGAVPLFLRRLGAERVVLLSFLILALFLTSLNRPAGFYLGNYKSVKALAETLSASLRPGDVVAQYGTYRQVIPFYTKRRSVLVEEVGELEYGADHAKDRAGYFLSAGEFQRLWNSGKRVFCVFGRGAMPLIMERFPDHRLLYRSDEGILIVNRY
ncbi:MAG: glycosyltransferase family 39 protein [Deltaproteobacteria bacterium]|nr:glycosyltransferase family 39 protein [Deltaproteobacteria bacterium]